MKYRITFSLVLLLVSLMTKGQESITLDRSGWPYIMFKEAGVDGARIQGTSGNFAVTNLDGNLNHLLVNSSSGYIGIGTANGTVASRLHINSAIERESLRIYKTGNTTSYLSIWQGVGGAAIDPIGTGKLFLGYDQSTEVVFNGNINTGTNQLQFLSASGGYNRVQSFGGSGVFGTWLFKSRFDHMVFDAGENSGNERRIIFKTGGSDRMIVDYNGSVGVGTGTPSSQLHLASNEDHALTISRVNGNYGFRIFRNATEGNVYFQIGNTSNTWETKIKIGEGEGVNTRLMLNPDGGSVTIGTTDPKGYKLAVAGKTITEEVVVKLQGNWPDYVFESEYKLPSLSELEQYIKANKHLPEVPSAEEVKKNGLSVGEMNATLLKKVEELTLHLIEQEKKNKMLQTENETLKKDMENRMKQFEERLTNIEAKK